MVDAEDVLLALKYGRTSKLRGLQCGYALAPEQLVRPPFSMVGRGCRRDQGLPPHFTGW